MSLPSSRPKSAREAFGQSFGGGRFTGLTTRQDPNQAQRPRTRLPLKLIVGILSAGLLVSAALHFVPAMRAGLHDGTRGAWVATTKTCHKSACIWDGKFVTPGGHVVVTSAQYAGAMPAGVHAGTSVPALFTGSSALVFPATGSDLWIELMFALLISILGLYWASHKWVANYIREHRNTVQIPGI
jgi:hypothetical protein